MKYKTLCNEFGGLVIPAAVLIPSLLGVVAVKITRDPMWGYFVPASIMGAYLAMSFETIWAKQAKDKNMGATRSSKMVQRNQMIAYGASFGFFVGLPLMHRAFDAFSFA